MVRINPNVYFTLWGIPFKIYGELVYIGAGIEKFNPVKNEFVVCRDHSNDLLEDVLKNNSNDYAIIHCLYNIPHAESRFLESIWQRESELKRYVVAKCFDYIPGYNILINKRIERKYKSTRLKNFVKMTEEEICKLKNETEQNKSLISVKSRKLLKRLF